MGKKFLAHITYRDGVRHEQSLRDHCRRSAKYAYDALEAVGLGMCAMLAALVHDMGKACERFMEYLEAAAAGKDVRRGSVNQPLPACDSCSNATGARESRNRSGHGQPRYWPGSADRITASSI